MTAFLLPQGKQQYFTAAGIPLVGGKVFTYDTGTTTPRSTWADAAQSSLNPNPVILDARGEATIFWSGAYRVALQDSLGNAIWTVDGVAVDSDQLRTDLANAVSAPLGAGLVGFNPTLAYASATVGGFLFNIYKRSGAEVAQSVTPTNYFYVPGDVRRYGTNTTPGTTPMTAAIANALLVSYAHRTIFQPETYLTGKQTIKSGYDIYMPPGCLLLDTGVLGVNDRFLNISSEVALGPIRNVHIEAWGAKIQLIKANYGVGEQRHALQIAGDVANIVVDGLECIDSGGDGCHIGGLGAGVVDTPERIRLNGCKFNNNRRNALSITMGKDVVVSYCEFTNTAGTSPQKGVDIEPDSSAGAMVGSLEDILVIGCYSEGNVGPGFSFVQPYTAVGKRIAVTFQDCEDNGSAVNFQMDTTLAGVNGVVRFRGCTGFKALSNGFEAKSSGMACEVDGMRIFDANQSGNITVQSGSSYAIFSINGTNGSTYGNVCIRNSFARGTAALKAFTQIISGEAASLMKDVDAEINTDGVATKRASYGLLVGQVLGLNRVVFTDKTEIASTVSLGASTMPAYLSDIITNTGAVAQIVLNLSDPLTRLPGVRVSFRVRAAQNMVIGTGSGWTIGGGAALWCNTPGAEVTVESDGVSKWSIVEAGDCWAIEPIVLAVSATPSIANGVVFQTGGAGTYTGLTGAVTNIPFTILLKHAVTFDCTGTTLKGNGGADFVGAANDVVRGVFDGTNYLLAFADCS